MTFWIIAANDLRQTVKDRMFFFWLLGFPLLFALIFGLAFPASGPDDRKASLQVWDKDQTVLTRSLVKELEGEKYAVSPHKLSEDERSARTLIIPEGFTEHVLAGRKIDLVLETEAGSDPEASQSAYSNTLKAIIKTLTRLIALAPESEADLISGWEGTETPRLITLRVESAGALGIIPAGFNHTIPAVAVMFILFTVLMYGGILLLQERRLGQLERIYLSPATFASIVGGKWLSRLLLGMGQLILLFIIGKILFNVDWGTSPAGLFLTALFYCGTIAGLSILLGSLIRKEEILIIINILLANLMAALGGCWFPLELVPPLMRRMSFLLPTGWAMDAMHKLIFFGQDLPAVTPHILVLAGFTAVFLVLAVRFFKLSKN